MTTQRLRGLDAAFLYLETPSQHMHVTATMLLEPEAGADGPERQAITDEVTATLLQRLAAQEAFRRRIVAAPLGIAHPAWVDVPHFQPREHLRALTLSSPGGIDELLEVVGKIAAVPLDRGRPLWELWVVSGVADGRIGVILKVHHAMLDGVSGLEVLARLFTTEPEIAGARPPSEIGVEPEVPSGIWLAAAALGALARVPVHLAQTLRHTVGAVVPFVHAALAEASAIVAPILPFSAPRSTLNHALTPARAVAFGRVPLAAVKEIKAAHGVTVNDVVLAACSLALGEYLRQHGEPPTQAIVASVPVSEHTTGDAGTLSNRVSAMFVGLPVHLTGSEDILAFIHAQSHGAKVMHDSLGPEMLADWAEIAPPTLLAAAADLYSRWQLAERLPPPHSIVVSNVAGPPWDLWVGTVRLAAAYPLGPVLEGAGINISVLSYAGSVDIGLITCPRAVANPAEIARGFERAVADMLASARSSAPSHRAAWS